MYILALPSVLKPWSQIRYSVSREQAAVPGRVASNPE